MSTPLAAPNRETVQRVWVVGTPGSGKSTVGRALAKHLHVLHCEIDDVFHQPNWTPLPQPQFQQEMTTLAAGDAWVIDGNYGSAVGFPIVSPRADTVVFLDLPKPLVIFRLMKRTIRRAITREELWNGNKEPLTNFTSLDPEKNVVVWAWQKHATYAQQYRTAMNDGTFAGKTVIHLASKAQLDEFLRNIAAAPPPTSGPGNSV